MGPSIHSHPIVHTYSGETSTALLGQVHSFIRVRKIGLLKNWDALGTKKYEAAYPNKFWKPSRFHGALPRACRSKGRSVILSFRLCLSITYPHNDCEQQNNFQTSTILKFLCGLFKPYSITSTYVRHMVCHFLYGGKHYGDQPKNPLQFVYPLQFCTASLLSYLHNKSAIFKPAIIFNLQTSNNLQPAIIFRNHQNQR